MLANIRDVVALLKASLNTIEKKVVLIEYINCFFQIMQKINNKKWYANRLTQKYRSTEMYSLTTTCVLYKKNSFET